MHDEEIYSARDRQVDRLRGRVNRRAQLCDGAGVFDLQSIERIWPIADLANAQMFVRVGNNLTERSHARSLKGAKEDCTRRKTSERESLDEICARLKGIGYDGPCTVQTFRPEYWEWDPMQLAVKAREAAIKVLSPYFEIEE